MGALGILLSLVVMLVTPGPAADTYLPLLISHIAPTVTPTVTPTSSPTPTCTPTPTQAPAAVYVLPNHSAYVDSIDNLHVFGEVQNDTPYDLRFVKVTASFFDIDGKPPASAWAYTLLLNVPAGARACFELLLAAPAGLHHYAFDPPEYWTDGDPLPSLTRLAVTGAYNPTSSSYEIAGQVRNDLATQVSGVMPVAAVHSASGTLLGCGWTFVGDLDPGESGSFQIRVWGWGRSLADVASYRLQIDGRVR